MAKILGYRKWENFEKVVAKAKIACEFNGHPVSGEFYETTTKRKVGSKGGSEDIREIQLTRYACYMIVLAADSSKMIVSHAKDYFAEQRGSMVLQKNFIKSRNGHLMSLGLFCALHNRANLGIFD